MDLRDVRMGGERAGRRIPRPAGLRGRSRRRLVEEPREEIALGRSAGGREGRGIVGEVEVEGDGGDAGRIGEKREDSHLATAGGTEQR